MQADRENFSQMQSREISSRLKLKELKLHNIDYRVKLRDASRSRKLLADAEQGDFTQTITLLRLSQNRLSQNSPDSNAPNELTMLVFIIS